MSQSNDLSSFWERGGELSTYPYANVYTLLLRVCIANKKFNGDNVTSLRPLLVWLMGSALSICSDYGLLGTRSKEITIPLPSSLIHSLSRSFGGGEDHKINIKNQSLNTLVFIVPEPSYLSTTHIDMHYCYTRILYTFKWNTTVLHMGRFSL